MKHKHKFILNNIGFVFPPFLYVSWGCFLFTCELSVWLCDKHKIMYKNIFLRFDQMEKRKSNPFMLNFQ